MNERRRYYRMEDTITLKYQIMEDHDYEQEIQFAEIDYIKQSDIHHTSSGYDSRIEELTQQLTSKDPLVSEIVTLLNKKISLMELMLKNQTTEDVFKNSMDSINISGSGIAFISEKPLQEDTPLKIELLLEPENEILSLLAKVISCREEENNSYIIAVDYEGISEDDREKIIQHVVKKQTLALKQRSKSN